MELQVGDAAHVKTTQGWVPVVVPSKLSVPRSYLVTTANGRSYRRTRRHLRKFPSEPVTSLPLPDVRELNIPLEEAQSTRRHQQHHLQVLRTPNFLNLLATDHGAS